METEDSDESPWEWPLQYQLNEREAFDAMRGYIGAFTRRNAPGSEGLNKLLRLTSRNEELAPSDPAQWKDWLDAVAAIREKSFESGMEPDTSQILPCVRIWAESLTPAFEAAGLKTFLVETPYDDQPPGISYIAALHPVETTLRIWVTGEGELEINDCGMVTQDRFDELFDPHQLARFLSRFVDRAHAMIASAKSKDEKRLLFE